MITRKTFGSEIGSGRAVILVKEKGLGNESHPFWKWLREEGFHLWLNHPNYGTDWIFINLNSMVCAPGMPGIKVVQPIREHAITIDEFKTIWKIFTKYEGLPVLKMPEEPVAKLILQDRHGTITIDEVTQSDMERLLLHDEIPLKEEGVKTRVLNEWNENPGFRHCIERAPSEESKRMAILQFIFFEYDTKELNDELDSLAEKLTLEDWKHLYQYCGNDDVKKIYLQWIKKLSDE